METTFMQNLTTGLTITLIGMTSVLVFLTIMICAINISKKIIEYINKFFPEAKEETISKKKKQEKADDEVALAILLATLQKGK